MEGEEEYKSKKMSRKTNILNFLFSSRVSFSHPSGGKRENSKRKGNIKSRRITVSHLYLVAQVNEESDRSWCGLLPNLETVFPVVFPQKSVSISETICRHILEDHKHVYSTRETWPLAT